MRKIGTIGSAKAAETFHQFLRSEGIENRVDEVGQAWEVWVLSDDDLPRARDEFASYERFPSDPRFKVKPLPKPAESQPRTRQMSEGSSTIPVTRFLLVGCIALTIYTGMGTRHPEVMRVLMFSQYVKPAVGWAWPVEIMQGEIWRIFTPAFIHGSFLHLAFNLYFLWILGNTIERTKGSARFLIFCLVTAAGAHFTEYFVTGPNFIGISGVVFGLLGYLWMKQMVSPEEGYYVPDIIVIQMGIWLALGISGALEAWGIHVANGAHLGGLLTGMLLGSFRSRRYSGAD